MHGDVGDMVLVRTAAERLREIAEKASPGPWFYNGYSWVGSNGDYVAHDEWEGKLLDEGHSLERYENCLTCGKWTWEWTNPKTGEVTVYDGRGCKFWTEAYNRDLTVAHVPSHHGDTAINVHQADAMLIERMGPNVASALADWLEEEVGKDSISVKAVAVAAEVMKHG